MNGRTEGEREGGMEGGSEGVLTENVISHGAITMLTRNKTFKNLQP